MAQGSGRNLKIGKSARRCPNKLFEVYLDDVWAIDIIAPASIFGKKITSSNEKCIPSVSLIDFGLFPMFCMFLNVFRELQRSQKYNADSCYFADFESTRYKTTQFWKSILKLDLSKAFWATNRLPRGSSGTPLGLVVALLSATALLIWRLSEVDEGSPASRSGKDWRIPNLNFMWKQQHMRVSINSEQMPLYHLWGHSFSWIRSNLL